MYKPQPFALLAVK